VSTLGIVLLLLGAALAAAEAHVPTHGAFGSAAALAVAGGIALVVEGAGFGTGVVRKALAVSRRRVRSGAEGLIGRVGEVRAAPAPLGQVFLDGALWRARVWSGDEDSLERGDPIVVERVDGLTLTVRRAEEWEVAP
jgi:membrane-bound ClpP family serine protease